MSGGNYQTKAPEKEDHLMLLHLGLGDNIICNGLVRTWLDQHPLVQTLHLPCRLNNLASVSWMYRDLGPRIKLLEVPNRNPYPLIFDQIKPRWPEGRVTDLTCFTNKDFEMTAFDREFYRLAGVDFEARWDRFYYDRDEYSELLGIAPVVIHDDPARSFTISRSRYPRVKRAAHVSEFQCRNIFRLVNILEKAQEIHAINSSIFNLMENLTPRPDQQRFWHYYARPDDTIPTTRLNWTKLN